MDQATESVTQDDFYAQYVKERRERVEKEEVKLPESVTCHIEMEADAADALLDLISQHFAKYSLKSQGFLVRASRSIEEGMKEAADAFRS